MDHTFVIHYSEVALKGKNRPEFARALRRGISRVIAEDRTATVDHSEGRFFLTTSADPAETSARLSRVFGIAWFAEATQVQADYDCIKTSVIDHANPGGETTFRISVRRSNKSFGVDSMEMERRLGAEVVSRTGRRVDLSHPGQTVHVDILRDRALVYSDRTRGPGGLPVGTAGRVMHLFSGGIDSPVAAWLLMKRGCTPVYLHFYLAPTPANVLESKVLRLIKVLSSFSGKSTMVLVPFAEYQLGTSDLPSDLEPSLFRRFMRLTGETLASRFGASGISTGDCLSQAASQTLWNLGVFDGGSVLPILRPLLTYDKEEVIRLARLIGTYDLSLEEYKDCCSMVTRHPKTRAKADIIGRYAETLDFPALISKSLEQGSLVTYSPASDETRIAPLNRVPATSEAPAAEIISRKESPDLGEVN